MSILQSIILGIVQGFTEFLPVSSSAHLVLVPYLLNWQLDPTISFIFNVLVQLGTLAAVILYFWQDLVSVATAFISGLKNRAPFAEADSRLGWLLLLGTIPAGLLGLLLKDAVEAAFNSPVSTALFLFGTAIMLTLAEVLSKKTRSVAQLKSKDAAIIGLFQAAAIFPGFSRSGFTIAGGLLLGLKREDAARFSFLLSIPVMAAAGLLALLDLLALPNLGAYALIIIIGFLTAFAAGYFSIRWLMRFVRQKTLFPFALYCGLLSVAVILVTYAR